MGSGLFKQAPTSSQSTSTTTNPSGQENTFINDLITSNDIVIFSKSNCGYCDKAKSVLDKRNMKYYALELDNHKKCPGEDCTNVIQALMYQTRMRTVPQIFYKGSLIGGYTELESMIGNGLFDQK